MRPVGLSAISLLVVVITDGQASTRRWPADLRIVVVQVPSPLQGWRVGVGVESPSWLEFSDRRVMEGLRAGPVEARKIGDIAAYLLGPDGAFITGSDLLIDGGVIAAMRGSNSAGAAARRKRPHSRARLARRCQLFRTSARSVCRSARKKAPVGMK